MGLTRSPAGVASPTADAKATNERTVVSMASVCDQLVLDIANDEECYQTAFPAECRIRLPAISCRLGTFNRKNMWCRSEKKKKKSPSEKTRSPDLVEPAGFTVICYGWS